MVKWLFQPYFQLFKPFPLERPFNQTRQATFLAKLPEDKRYLQTMRPNLFLSSTLTHIFYKPLEILEQGVEALWPQQTVWQDGVNHHRFLI